MKPQLDKKALMRKRIPTLAGLGILVVGLIVGVIFLGTGPGVFAPRATPETTPSKIRLTNVTDAGFTVSFYTASLTPGFIKYGTETNSIKSQTGDDRDQLSGTVGNYKLHHITLRGLKPSTTYYYVLGTGSGASFDNNGAPFTVQTAARGGAPSAAKTAYGNVLDETGNPSNGSIVYASLPGVGEMSSLVKSSGSWAIPLANARKADGSGYATIEDTDNMTLFVQGTTPSQTSELSVTVANSQPVADITLGQNGSAAAETGSTAEDVSHSDNTNLLTDREEFIQNELPAEEGDNLEIFSGEEQELLVEEDLEGGTGLDIEDQQNESLGGLENTLVESSDSAQIESVQENTRVVFEDEATHVSTTQTPVISGVVKPNVTLMIQVNSDTQIEQELVADENGYFELDIEALKANLEPGEHTATYTYTDPETGEEVTKTITFTVEPEAGGIGGPQETTPYGSGNPFTIEATNSAQATQSAQASGSGDLATRSAITATDSPIPVSGSVGTTMALVFGGIFFIIAGGWSYYLATQIEVKEI